MPETNTSQEKTPRLYRRKNSPVWYCWFYRDGRAIRKSTKCIDLEAAKQVLADYERYAVSRSRAIDKMGWVYFLRSDGGPIKIGFTSQKSPAQRVRQYGTHNPTPVAMLGILRGTRQLEGEIHARFDHLRLEGEWFKVGDDLMRFIEEYTRKPELEEIMAIRDKRRRPRH